MSRLVSAFNTFLLVIFGQIFALAVSEGFGGLRIDPFGSRKALFFVMLGIAVGAAILRWSMLGARIPPASVAGPSPRTDTPEPSAVRDVDLTRLAQHAAAMHAASAAPQQTAPSPSTRGSDLIDAASRQAIVFRQHFPPHHDRSIRSFFGGAPIVPRGFLWPRAGGPHAQGKPLHFLLQIDCAAVPAAARLGALPRRGVLYFFLDLTMETLDGRVIYADEGSGGWEPVAPPDDLVPAFGNHALYVWGWTQSLEQCPVLLPKWTFEPVVIELPEPIRDEEEDEGAPVLWPESVAAALLLEAQGDATRYDYLTVRDVIDGEAVRRPFPDFPHDWRALQICSAGLVRHADRHRRNPRMTLFRSMDKAASDALLAEISAEAQSWFDRAASQPAFDEVSRADRDAFWEFVARHPELTRFVLVDALTQSIESSLEHSEQAAARIPAELAERIRGRHALAVVVDAGVHANIPDRMLAPPVDVQGNQWERAQTHLLLLEISSNEGLGHHFGEGVYQFWIKPEDLEAGRFDKVELTADAY